MAGATPSTEKKPGVATVILICGHYRRWRLAAPGAYEATLSQDIALRFPIEEIGN